MKKLLIIDGNSILNRAYYGIRPLTAPDGTPTNAVYGFLNIMFKYLEEETPDMVCVAFDVKEKTFRHKMYTEYKAQRKPAPEDFLVQLPLIKEVLSAMNCLCLELPGYEADDIIGTISRICDESDVACRILTGDKDDLQLASLNTVIKLVITKMGQTSTTDYGIAEFKEKYGIEPDSFIDVKALMGDTSDNIPGVKGIGEKTAFSLIQNYNSIDNIYASIDALDVTDSVRKKLIEGKDDAYLSYKLATIDKNVPIDFKLSDADVKEYNKEALASLFARLNFNSFIKKLDLSASVGKTEDIKQISGQGEKVSFTTLLDKSKNKTVSYIKDNDTLFVKPSDENGLYSPVTKDELKNFLADETIKKIGYNIKEDIISVGEFGIDTTEAEASSVLFDVVLGAYILDPSTSDYSIESLCHKYLGTSLEHLNQENNDSQISMLGVLSDNTPGNLDKVFALEELYNKMSNLLKEKGQDKLYYDIELPLMTVLASMQIRGMYIDKDELAAFGEMLDKKIVGIRDEIYSLAGEEFNINSPKQLGVILFEKLELPFGKKNKSGGYSTNIDVMEKLKDKHPIVNLVLEYRQLTKLQSTYVVGLSSVVNEKTGRIHSNFNQTVTATGRISSTEPNMQNIPVRTELGREIRKMFIAEYEGWSLIDADYSQIELRVLAHIANDASMKEAFLSGEDIHAQTAANVFNVPLSEVTSKMRSSAKAVNFGIVYGIGAFSLAQDIGTTRKEAQEYIDGYLAHYSGVAEYMKKTIDDARESGYITTVSGRRRYLPELNASNHMTRAFGERVAMNAPIQGSAADIIKIAMVNVYKKLKENNLKAKLILQVHDELIVEAPNEELEIASKILRDEMEKAYELSVPLSVDMNTGLSWYDTK